LKTGYFLDKTIAMKLVINFILNAGDKIDTPICLSSAPFFIFSTYIMSNIDYAFDVHGTVHR